MRWWRGKGRERELELACREIKRVTLHSEPG